MFGRPALLLAAEVRGAEPGVTMPQGLATLRRAGYPAHRLIADPDDDVITDRCTSHQHLGRQSTPILLHRLSPQLYYGKPTSVHPMLTMLISEASVPACSRIHAMTSPWSVR